MTRRQQLQQRRNETAAACPELRVGDVWKASNGSVREIVALKVEDASVYPWPMCRVRIGDHETELGAPAFIGDELLKRGKGEGWRPPV